METAWEGDAPGLTCASPRLLLICFVLKGFVVLAGVVALLAPCCASLMGILFAPGVLVDGAPFSYGRRSERKLRRHLARRAGRSGG